MTSTEKIAQWMLDEFNKHGRLTQSIAAHRIRVLFGDSHVYRNKNRNWAIQKPILDDFRRLTGNGVVWSRSNQSWRSRRPTDPLGTRMVK
ncbi:hypothetical protein NDA01_19980 [Trichocoleus desertorum AS-A10]|uniref:DUF6953 family protein n=1 Tax=Trichocoleus desertorum TaxID=1481672 RepID=UPI0032994667